MDTIATIGASARTGYDPSTLGVDVSACDREPIHIPGSIQPHGLLLIADGDGRAVIGGAGAIEDRLDPDWLGRRLDDLLTQDVAAAIARAPADAPVVLASVEGRGERFNAVLRRAAEGRLLVELEPAPAAAVPASGLLTLLDGIGLAMDRTPDLERLCQTAAEAFRDLTGFDRVMIYRFLDDDAGVVLAEARDERVRSFLNHHFPASDIPRQARALYVRNRIRVIPDARYVPAPIRPDAAGLAGIDLSDVALRSVSPIHLQYLHNMGVRASASISIVRDDMLWGLVAAHHHEPHGLNLDQRLACTALAAGLSRQIRAKESRGDFRERIRLRAAEDTVVAKLGSGPALAQLFGPAGEDVRAMLGADGFAAVQGGDLFQVGRCPDAPQLAAIAGWARQRALVQPIASANLEALFAPAAACRAVASGLLAVTMPTEEPTTLLWFRAEQIAVVNWAGNPHKAVGSDGSDTLTPRASFDAWSEDVRGRSQPWTREEVEAASRLKRALFDARQTDRLRQLNRDLAATIADKESLIAQKDYLMGEVNHRVQNSLQLVSAFLGLQARAAGDDRVTAQLAEAQRRLSAVALVHRRLYSDDSVEVVDLGRYLDDLLNELSASMDEGWANAMRRDLEPILIATDRAVSIGLICTELVINANKYAYDGAPGPIEVTLEQNRAQLRLTVADQGVGKTGSGSGFGTRVLNAMIARLDGTIEEEARDRGLRVVVTAPIEASR